MPGYGTFETRDGLHVALGVLTENHFWRSLCDVLGLTDCRDLAFGERMTRLVELQSLIAAPSPAALAMNPSPTSLRPMSPPRSVQDRSAMLTTTHFRERSVVTSEPGSDPSMGYPVQFDRHPAVHTAPAPGLDQHRGGGFQPRRDISRDRAR